jgi:xanthine dehydrogenase accessory factor
MKGAAALFRFLIDRAGRGERTALVTITDVIGSASRAPGTHMAVSETGAWVGSLSGGCVEGAVVGEAKRVIEADHAELIRFGAGSPFIDIRLPVAAGWTC